VRERHGDAAIDRVSRAFAGYCGGEAPPPTHPLQQPSFLFVPGLPDKPWWEREAFPFLAALEAQTDAIREELLQVLADEDGLAPYVDMPDDAPAAPMWRTLNRSPRWSGYHLYRHGDRIEAHARRCPRTMAALEALPLLRIPGHGPEALFSVLRPGTHIPPHTGVINGRLTVHLPLMVPPDCGALAAAREPRAWREGECLVFDDSFVHEAWNRSGRTRVVLIFDVWNPDLSAAEREALAAGIAAIGEFHRRHGGADPMREAEH
jgi:aspartate beta-hydroxylase